VNWKYLFLDNYAYWNLVWKKFKMSLQYFDKKMSFYLFIAISFYHNIVSKNIVCDVGLSLEDFLNPKNYTTFTIFHIKGEEGVKMLVTSFSDGPFFCFQSCSHTWCRGGRGSKYVWRHCLHKSVFVLIFRPATTLFNFDSSSKSLSSWVLIILNISTPFFVATSRF